MCISCTKFKKGAFYSHCCIFGVIFRKNLAKIKCFYSFKMKKWSNLYIDIYKKVYRLHQYVKNVHFISNFFILWSIFRKKSGQKTCFIVFLELLHVKIGQICTFAYIKICISCIKSFKNAFYLNFCIFGFTVYLG